MNSCASVVKATPKYRTPLTRLPLIWRMKSPNWGPYEFICTGRPDEGIPAVCFKLKDGEDPGYTLYDLSERLRLRGWQVPAFTLGGEATDIVVMRIMCRRGFEMDFAELLLEDYKASLKYLSDHPKLQGIAQQNSFKHT